MKHLYLLNLQEGLIFLGVVAAIFLAMFIVLYLSFKFPIVNRFFNWIKGGFDFLGNVGATILAFIVYGGIWVVLIYYLIIAGGWIFGFLSSLFR